MFLLQRELTTVVIQLARQARLDSLNDALLLIISVLPARHQGAATAQGRATAKFT